MKRINYRYTNLPKQILIFAALAYVVMLAIIMAEIAIFKLEGFYEETNFLLHTGIGLGATTQSRVNFGFAMHLGQSRL